MKDSTKEYRFRINWRGQLILQSKYEHYVSADSSGHSYSETRWKDVTIKNISFLQGLDKNLTQ